jgi:hypothetical protein
MTILRGIGDLGMLEIVPDVLRTPEKGPHE